MIKNYKRLLDEDGENQAVRSFLMIYAGNNQDINSIKTNMDLCGYPYWPEWVNTEQGHLTKSGAQLWLRHLFNLEKDINKDN